MPTTARRRASTPYPTRRTRRATLEARTRASATSTLSSARLATRLSGSAGNQRKEGWGRVDQLRFLGAFPRLVWKLRMQLEKGGGEVDQRRGKGKGYYFLAKRLGS